MHFWSGGTEFVVTNLSSIVNRFSRHCCCSSDAPLYQQEGHACNYVGFICGAKGARVGWGI